MWPVNMTCNTEGWPVNSSISPNIVRWRAIIFNPAAHFQHDHKDFKNSVIEQSGRQSWELQTAITKCWSLTKDTASIFLFKYPVSESK